MTTYSLQEVSVGMTFSSGWYRMRRTGSGLVLGVDIDTSACTGSFNAYSVAGFSINNIEERETVTVSLVYYEGLNPKDMSIEVPCDLEYHVYNDVYIDVFIPEKFAFAFVDEEKGINVVCETNNTINYANDVRKIVPKD